MPKVPVYQTNSVQDAQTPNVAINANTTVANYESPLTKVVEAVPQYVKIYQKQKESADKMAVLEADAKLSKLETDLLYDKNNGAVNKKGKDAFSVPELVADGWNKGSKSIADTLTSDEQKAMFHAKQLERGSSIDRTVQKHVGDEIIRYDTNTTSSLIKNEQDAAISAWKDPSRVALAVKNQQDAIQSYGERNGMGPEEITQKVSSAVSKTHANVIGEMLVNDQDLTAQAYYKANKDSIKGDELTNVEKQLETGSLRGQSQRFVDDVFKRGLSESQAIEEARKVQDPKLKDALYERVKMEFNIRESANKKKLEDYHVSALNLIDRGGVKDLTKTPGWNEMDSSQRNSLSEYAKKKIQGNDIITNYNVYYDLKTMASVPELRDKFVKMNLMEKRNDLNNGDFEKMVDLQSKLRQGKPEAQKILDGFRSDAQVVKQTYEAAGLPKDSKEKVNLFNSRVEQEQIAQEQRLNRKLNNIELKAIADNQAQKIVLKERAFWFNDTKNLFEMSDDQVKTIPYKAVPTSEKLKIENALKKMGRKADEESVRQMYIIKTLKDRSVGK